MADVVIVREPSPPQVVEVESTGNVVQSGVGAQGPQGPAGPAGAPGASGGAYRHVQGSASTTWTVTHNLGYRPGGVQAFENLGSDWQEVEGDIDHVSDNQLTLTFSAPMSGECYVS